MLPAPLPPRRADDRTALICTYPLFTSFFLFGATRSNLASYLSTVYCFSNLLFLGIAQRNVGKVGRH